MDNKVIGHLAYITKTHLICDGDSCVIAGSEEKIKSYIKQMSPELYDKVTIKKARFKDIKRGLEFGAAYSFDEEAYNCFHPIALKAGISTGQEGFTGKIPRGLHLIQIQKVDVSKN